MPHPVLDLAERFRAQALARERGVAIQLVRAYGNVYRNLSPEIAALEEAIRGMDTPRPVDIGRLGALRVLRQQAIDELNRYAAFADTVIVGEVRSNMAVGLRDSAALVEAYFDPEWLAARGIRRGANMIDAVRAAWVRVPVESVETMVGMTSAGSPLRAALVNKLGPTVADRMVDALVTGIAQGKNPRLIARQGMAAGLQWSLTTARTAQLYAYREATRANYRANRDIVSGWRWLATLSARTCASCLGMHGTTHTVDEVLDDHHNGRCTAIPIVPLAAKLGLPEPDIPDAEAWLRAQPEAAQKAQLGPGMWEEWQSGRAPLASLTTTYDDPVYGTMRRAPTLAEVTTRPPMD